MSAHIKNVPIANADMLRNSLLGLAIVLLLTFCAEGETYVVSVGVANYADAKVQNLANTEKDAKAMAAFYKKGTKNVIVITGKYATKSNILKSMRSQFGRAAAGDKIVFYFSGHGYPGGFCPYDMHGRKDGLTYEDVFDIMKKSKATNKFIFADACNSGAIRQQQDNRTAAPKPDGNIMLFLSSRGNESSIESPFLANGYFTKHLLRGLGGAADSDGDRHITASELFSYVSVNVKKDTRDKQHPVMWGTFPDNMTIVKYRKK